jgi:LysM repeat protein
MLTWYLDKWLLKLKLFPIRLLLAGMIVLLVAACTSSQPTPVVRDIEAFVPPVRPAVQAEVLVRLEPSDQQLNAGQAAAIDIILEDVVDLVGAEVQLQFDPAILQAQDADPGQEGIQLQPGDPRMQDYVAQNRVDNITGLALYSATQIGPFEPMTGDVVVATLRFQAAAPGTSSLTFTSVILLNDQAQVIPTTTQPGQITVGPGTGEPTATFTPTSTLVPGQPTFTPSPTSIIVTLTPGLITPSPTASPVQPTPTLAPSPTSTPLPTPTLTPIPPFTEIPPGATIGFCYRVRPGESFYHVAQKFGIAPAYLNRVNDLYPPGYVVVNQPLFIPEQQGHGPNIYITRPGDTLAGIADGCGFSTDILARANDLSKDAILQAGHVLFIPIPPFPNPSRYVYPPPGVGGSWSK